MTYSEDKLSEKMLNEPSPINDEAEVHAALGEALAAISDDDIRRTVYRVLREAQALRGEVAGLDSYKRIAIEETDAEIAPKAQRIAELEAQAREYTERLLVPGGHKSVAFPTLATVRYRDVSTSVRIADKELFLDWARAEDRQDLYETRDVLLTNEAKAVAKDALLSDGVLLAGVEEVPADRTSTIDWEAS